MLDFNKPETQQTEWTEEDFRREAEKIVQQEKEKHAGDDPETSFLDLSLYRAARLINSPNMAIDWLFVDSLMVQTVGLICGAAGAGKSQLVLQFVCAIASSLKSMAGVFVPGIMGKVVCLFAEDDDRIIQTRLKNIISAFSENPEEQKRIAENLIIVPGNGQDWRFLKNSKGNAEPSKFFYQLIQSLKALGDIALVVIDPMSRFYGGEENDNSSATVFISLLEQIKEELNTTVICVHHIGKGNAVSDESSLNKALHQDAARGASALTGAARWQLNVAPIPGKVAKSIGLAKGGGRYIDGRFLAGQVSKNNYGPPGKRFYLERGAAGVLFQADVSGTNAELERVLLAKIIEELEKIQSDKKGPGKITKRAFKDVYTSRWKKEIPGVTGPLILQAIEAGLLSGELIEVEGLNVKKQKAVYLGIGNVTK